ncbi:MAG: GNAT family N-acetyltransferase [Sphingomonas fennica]
MTQQADIVTTDRHMILRAMGENDLAAVHALAKAEQWPHRTEDLSDMLGIGQGIVAEMGGKIVATTMWWPAGVGVHTLGIVIVARSHRGAGLGRIVMEAALDRIGPEATVLLNATDDGLPLYRKLGFSGFAEIRQHQGAAFFAPLVPLAPGERIRPMGERDHAPVAALIEGATGLSRPATMAVLLAKGHGVVLDCDGSVEGVAIFRRFGRGYVIGPVVATDATRARALIAQWLGSRSGEFVRLDIDPETRLGPWLDELGIVEVGRVVTMVRGSVPPLTGAQRSYAIVSQALG